jgi:hypothetical protein
MSKITYHKYCRHHAGVKKVKREFVKLLKQFEHIETSCYIDFTGVADEDLFNLNYRIRINFVGMYRKLTNEIEDSKKDFHSEFSTNFYIDIMNFIKGIDKIIGIVHEDYPINVMEYTFNFRNPEASVEEKKHEYERHFTANPLNGFRKEYFFYRGESKRQIWPLTVSPDELTGVDKIVIQYQ